MLQAFRKLLGEIHLYRRLRFALKGSAQYWEHRYRDGGNSGDGSYGALAEAKASFLNQFVVERGVRSVLEFGCGDGNQLSLCRYPNYIGVDVSETAIDICRRRFQGDPRKTFHVCRPDGLIPNLSTPPRAELVLSLDVIYHLVEDDIFEGYMRTLFSCAERYVVIYSSNEEGARPAPHVRSRRFTDFVSSSIEQAKLLEVDEPPSLTNQDDNKPDMTPCSFFVYEAVASR